MANPVAQMQEQTLKVVNDALQTGTMQRARRILTALHPAEIANLLEALPHSQRGIVWNMLDHDDDGEILLNLGDEVRNGLIKLMDSDALVSATEGLEMDDLADLLADLPDTVAQQALAAMDYQDRQRLESVLSYDEDTAGGLMSTDTVTVRCNVTLDVVLRYLRTRGRCRSPRRGCSPSTACRSAIPPGASGRPWQMWASRWRAARPWRWWGLPVPARAPCWACCCASTTPSEAG